MYLFRYSIFIAACFMYTYFNARNAFYLILSLILLLFLLRHWQCSLVTEKEKNMVNNVIGTFNKKIEMHNLSQRHGLITSCLPMMHALSIKIARKTGYPREDLFQESVLGLLRALEFYKGKNGAKFSTYAYFWAMSFISNYIDREEKNASCVCHENTGKTAQSPEHILLEKEMKNMLNVSLLHLKPIQLKIIRLRFFADQNQNRSLEKLSAELCIEKTKIKRIYRSALLNLRSKYNEYR